MSLAITKKEGASPCARTLAGLGKDSISSSRTSTRGAKEHCNKQRVQASGALSYQAAGCEAPSTCHCISICQYCDRSESDVGRGQQREEINIRSSPPPSRRPSGTNRTDLATTSRFRLARFALIHIRAILFPQSLVGAKGDPTSRHHISLTYHHHRHHRHQPLKVAGRPRRSS